MVLRLGVGLSKSSREKVLGAAGGTEDGVGLERLSNEGLRIPSLPKSDRGHAGADGLCSVAGAAVPTSRADDGRVDVDVSAKKPVLYTKTYKACLMRDVLTVSECAKVFK